MIAAEVLVLLLSAYAALGTVFAIAFVLRGIAQIDPIAKVSTLGFRLMVLAGAAALWPLLLKLWIQKTRVRT